MRLPDLHEISIVLAQSLFDRYDTTLLDDDYEKEMAVTEKVIAFRDPGDGPSPQREAAVELATMFADKKFLLKTLIDLGSPNTEQLSFLHRLRSHNSTSTSTSASTCGETAEKESGVLVNYVNHGGCLDDYCSNCCFVAS